MAATAVAAMTMNVPSAATVLKSSRDIAHLLCLLDESVMKGRFATGQQMPVGESLDRWFRRARARARLETVKIIES